MSRSLLVISRQAPWAGSASNEALDLVLSAAAFDLPVSLLLMDDGVLQLAGNQQPKLLQQKNLQANLAALELFGVEQLYACERSLLERGVHNEPLTPLPTRLDEQQIADLINSSDQVITL